MLRLLLLILACAPCFTCGAEETIPYFNPLHPDPLNDSWQVWERGAEYLQDDPALQKLDDVIPLVEEIPSPVLAVESSEERSRPFIGFKKSSAHFLKLPNLAPAVQFSCALGIRAEESVLKTALADASQPEIRLQALVLLLKVHSPSCVPQQWAALQELKKLAPEKPARWKELLEKMEACFTAPALQAALAQFNPPPLLKEMDRYGDLPAYEAWAMRAAGVRQCREVLPQLREWSCSEHLHTSITAERSLEDFEGPDGDEALAHCVQGWQYNAAEYAAKALLKRDRKGQLHTALLAIGKPKDREYIYGVLLGQCGDSRAVPILCAHVGHINIIDGQMFKLIEELAELKHLPLLQKLPEQVRPGQKETAEKLLKKVQAKFN